jgi:acyl-CoA thioesterase
MLALHTTVPVPSVDMSDESSGAFPLRDLLGFTMETGDGRSTGRLTVDARHINPHGTVHGAVMFALIDTAMGGATMSVVEEGNRCATVDITTRFLAPCFGGELVAVATVRRAGRRIVHLDATVTDGGDKEYTAATGVFAVIPAG